MFSPERRALSPLGAAPDVPVGISSCRAPCAVAAARPTPLVSTTSERMYDVLGVLLVIVGRRELAGVADGPLVWR